MHAHMRRFVLDVRNNGGGLFPAGIEVARQWLSRGDIVLIADSQVTLTGRIHKRLEAVQGYLHVLTPVGGAEAG